MARVIRITESDLEKIVKRVLREQREAPSDYLGKGGGFERQNYPIRAKYNFNFVNYKCLPQMLQVFANYVTNNKEKLMAQLGVDKNILLLMAKAAMGTIGRETTFGKGTDFGDEAAEFLMNWGLGMIPRTAQAAYNQARKISGKGSQQMSLGAAQFTQDTWNSYGLDKKIGPYDKSLNAINQGLGTLYRIAADYKTALSTGNGTGPSVNPIALRQGKIKSINGTGNNALDLAIVSHNMSGLINKWCETSDPNYAGPCKDSVYQPFPESKPELKYNVLKNKPIVNYFPNKKSGKLTSIGYLEEVTNYIKQFDCFSI